jgi:hypothetical protein
MNGTGAAYPVYRIFKLQTAKLSWTSYNGSKRCLKISKLI